MVLLGYFFTTWEVFLVIWGFTGNLGLGAGIWGLVGILGLGAKIWGLVGILPTLTVTCVHGSYSTKNVINLKCDVILSDSTH